MPTPLPQSVQETLGDPAAGDSARWLKTYVEERAVMRGEYRKVLTRLDLIDERVERVDERFDHVEQRLDETNERLDQVDQRLDEQSAQFNQRLDEQSRQLNERIDGVSERIDRLHEQMRVQTRWTVGTIALFGTIVTVLLAIAEFSA